MKVPDALIDFVQSSNYDYWDWLQDEYQFITSDNGKSVKNKIFTPGLLREIFASRKNKRWLYPDSPNRTGIYNIPRNRQELKRFLQKDEITMVLTIEGMHSLGTDTAGFSTYLKRVEAMKKTWATPIFFVTFAHHFNNLLCGHARSFPDIGTWVMNQDERKDDVFTQEGRAIIRKLLSIDRDNVFAPSEGYRILIDVKHMSAASRKEYYDEIVNPCFEKGDIIPVIASHCGYSGLRTLEAHIKACQGGKECDDYFDSSGMYNAWNINMCDEDILMIFKTGGLFGLSFDQRILGVPKSKQNKGSKNTIQALWNNIKGVLQVIYGNNGFTDAEKSAVWNCISIGTDFEGYIDPVDPYANVLDFASFELDHVKLIDNERKVSGSPACLAHLKSRADVEIAVAKLCYGNCEAFVLKHYPS
jgi:microsomal dipeptidase-like Zn-dependent dipeptidase